MISRSPFSTQSCWTVFRNLFVPLLRKYNYFSSGTIITEWDDGAALCKQMLVSTDQVHEVTTKLANIAAFYGFDGWLINIENKIEVSF